MKYLILASVEELFGTVGYSRGDALMFERKLTRLIMRLVRISLMESGRESLRNFLKNIIDCRFKISLIFRIFSCLNNISVCCKKYEKVIILIAFFCKLSILV